MNKAQRELDAINEDTPGWETWDEFKEKRYWYNRVIDELDEAILHSKNNLGNKLYRERIAELRARGLV